MKVLLVEDYAPVRDAVARALREDGHAVDVSSDGEDGNWHATTADYDAIVLDIVLPKLDGLSVLRQIRKRGGNAPVLLLTARDTVADRVIGLDAGADDYLVKPFAIAELLARVRALIRRRYESSSTVIRIHDLEIDTAGRIVTRAGERVELTAREYALLEFLARRSGKIVTRAEIEEHVYDFRSPVESNVVDVYVGYLRRKLEHAGQSRLLFTRRGLGYVLE